MSNCGANDSISSQSSSIESFVSSNCFATYGSILELMNWSVSQLHFARYFEGAFVFSSRSRKCGSTRQVCEMCTSPTVGKRCVGLFRVGTNLKYYSKSFLQFQKTFIMTANINLTLVTDCLIPLFAVNFHLYLFRCEAYAGRIEKTLDFHRRSGGSLLVLFPNFE
jgi:hypothetical protein